jgi:Tfp pilus assembly protein PilO
MKRKIKRLELILLGVWLIIVIAVVAYMAVSKASFRFNQLDDQITLNQEKLARLSAIVKQEKELNVEYEKALAGYNPIKDSDSLLQEIESIARKLNVNIVNIKPVSTKEEAAYKSYSIRIEGQDDVYAVAKFLDILTDELRSVSIERMQVSSQNRNELPKVSVVVNALVFKQ